MQSRILSPRDINKAKTLGALLTVQDTFDEDSSMLHEYKDHSFLEMMNNNPSGGFLQPLRDFNQLDDHHIKPFLVDSAQELQFYEDLADTDAYDYELIDDLFHSKKKHKFSKHEKDKKQDTFLQTTTDGYLETQHSAFDAKHLASPDSVAARKSTKRNAKLDLNAILEYFDPIKGKKALSKKTKSVKLKDKGSTQKHGIPNKKVPADQSTAQEHGLITYYGNVQKQRFKYN